MSAPHPTTAGSEELVSRTPAAQWREKGEPDPHGNRYDCERAALCMGTLTDDELANGVFMHGDGTHGRPSIEDILAGRAHSPIAWLTAAKDRIRWLSRQLEAALATSAPPAAVPADHEQVLWLRELFALVEKWRDTRDGTPSKAEAWSALWKHAHNLGQHWRARATSPSTLKNGGGQR